MMSIYTEYSQQTDGAPAEQALSSAGPNWNAIRVRPRFEKLVASALHGKGYEEFLPLYRKRNRLSSRMKEVDLPLFPGYVFCRADWMGKPRLVSTPGVLGVLSFANRPATISEEEIDGIKLVLRSGVSMEPWPYLREGQRVRVQRGALMGLEGIVIRTKSDFRIVLSVDALCRSLAVEVYSECVSPVS